MRDGEPQIYTALAQMRNGYMQTQWQRVQMFLVFNTVGLPIVFGAGPSDRVKLLISVVGLGMHAVILQATLRADKWIQFLDARMSELELLDDNEAAGTRVRVISHPDFMQRRHSLWASRKFFGGFGIGLLGIWVWQFVNYLWSFLH